MESVELDGAPSNLKEGIDLKEVEREVEAIRKDKMTKFSAPMSL